MTKYIVLLFFSFLLLEGIFACVSADSESLSPVGTWLVKDGTAHIRIVQCEAKIWGVISWVDKPGTDANNPDVSKRSRSVLGMPILLGMLPHKQNEWEGEIYNAENGKIYNSYINVYSADALHVSGCIFGGLLCGGEDWTRLKVEDNYKPAHEICRMVNQ